ncbi:Hypothetical protein PHPALM_2838 [Phytophthora palmivora]|uniref:Uncharacterized protein n=1 Tax=Phytophthora palmivora TaxID=4796 RepID=A0A2P4YNU7_9STRA|nr:Hypothetical protein PHPALM_2838 [Phytophthora palmivora]
MHSAVKDQRLKQRLLNKKRERGENLVNFTVGDFVLRSRVDEKHGNKLQVTWIDVHASRLKMYADDSLDVTDELLEHISAQGIVLAVDKLKSHRWNAAINDYEIEVSWKGLQPIEDSHEPLADLANEIHTLVDKYVHQANDQGLAVHWKKTRPGGRQNEASATSTASIQENQDTSGVQVNTGKALFKGLKFSRAPWPNNDIGLQVVQEDISGVEVNTDAALCESQLDSSKSWPMKINKSTWGRPRLDRQGL